MPNHVRNILRFDCDEKRRAEILAFIQSDELGPGSIDFNKILPMPESLNMPSGSMTNVAINAYLSAVNPQTPDCGLPKMEVIAFTNTLNQMNAGKHFGLYNAHLPVEDIRGHAETSFFSDEPKQMSADERLAAFLGHGKQYVQNMLEHGSITWYEWCNRVWGTKWNAYDAGPGEDGAVTFSTAWDYPEPVIEALSKQFPDATVRIRWADEDLGQNVGAGEYQGGVLWDCEYPEPGSAEAYEMAASIWGYDLEEMGYRLSDDGGTYIYHEELSQRYRDEEPQQAQEQSM